MSGSIAGSGPFAPASLDVLAPRIDVASFRAGDVGHVVAMEADGAHPELRIARLRDVICVPGGIVLRGNRVLAEGIAGEGEAARHRHMLRDRAGDWHLHPRDAATGPVANRIGEPVLWLDEIGDVPPGSAPMLELAARLWTADYARAFLGIEAMRSLTAWPAPPFAPKLIEAGGVRGRDVFFFDRPIVCDELIVATRAQRLPDYTTPAASQLWGRITDRFAPPGAVDARAPRLLLARGTGPDRALLAGARLHEMLSPHGFTAVDPDLLDIVALARLVAGASLLAGVSGGGLAALGFARHVRGVLAVGPATATERLLLAGRSEIGLVQVDGLPDETAIARFVAGHG